MKRDDERPESARCETCECMCHGFVPGQDAAEFCHYCCKGCPAPAAAPADMRPLDAVERRALQAAWQAELDAAPDAPAPTLGDAVARLLPGMYPPPRPERPSRPMSSTPGDAGQASADDAHDRSWLNRRRREA